MKFLKLLHKNHCEPELDKERENLQKTYRELLSRLSDIRANFGFACDDASLDALIYEENAVLRRLERLYSDAKEQGLTLDYHEFSRKQQ